MSQRNPEFQHGLIPRKQEKAMPDQFTNSIPDRESGFSLIELMMAVVIIGIIAGIGIPTYKAYIVDARRLDAQVALRVAGQALERCRTQAFTYVGCSFPADSPDGYYTITGTLTVSAYSLTATPATGKSQAGDSDCTTLLLSQTGQQTATGATPTKCW